MLALFGGGAWYVFQNRENSPAVSFVAATNQKDAVALRRLFNAALADHTDIAVLQLWLNAVQDALGTTSIADPKSIEAAQSTVEGSARQVVFTPLKGAKQDASLELEIVDGGINRFEILSDQIAVDWFEKLEKTDLYQKEAESFLIALLGNKPDLAYGLLHADAREVLSIDEMRQMALMLNEQAGAMQGKPVFRGFRFETFPSLVGINSDEGERRLRLVYDVECERGAKTRAALDFKLEGFRFFLIAFDLTGNTDL